MPKIRTSAIIAISMAIGIAGGAGVTAVAQQQNMRSALDHLVAADAFLAKANNNKGGHRNKARSLIGLAITEVKNGIKFAN
jgi:hypothetical protein